MEKDSTFDQDGIIKTGYTLKQQEDKIYKSFEDTESR